MVSSTGAGRLRRALKLVPVALMVAMASACGDAFKAHPQNTFKAEGKQNHTILNLVVPVFAIAAVVFVGVMGACVYIALRFRDKGEEVDEADMPRQIHGHFAAELGWTILPAIILLAVAVPTVFTVFKLNEKPKKDALHVEVIGQQWWWEYRYDLNDDGKFDEITTANDLVIPAGRQIALSITSRDVIHSFWVPQLNGKRDAVPNRTAPWLLQADHPGEYIGQCTEFCGLSHAEMRIKAIAVTDAQFATWSANQQKKAATYDKDDTSPQAVGYRLFLGQLCSSCHLVNGVNNTKFQTGKDIVSGTIKDKTLQVSKHAPNLTHLMSRTTFAGAKFDLRLDTPACVKLGLDWSATDANLTKCLDRAALEAWIRNAPSQKAMAPDGVPGRTYGRGMPNLHLTEDQIDQLVTYLMTLK